MDSLVKAAFILSATIIIAVGIYVYFSPFQTCIRNHAGANAVGISGSGAVLLLWCICYLSPYFSDSWVVFSFIPRRSFTGPKDSAGAIPRSHRQGLAARTRPIRSPRHDLQPYVRQDEPAQSAPLPRFTAAPTRAVRNQDIRSGHAHLGASDNASVLRRMGKRERISR